MVMGKGFAIRVKYGRVPQFCKFCNKIGHLENKCLATGRLSKEEKYDPSSSSIASESGEIWR